MKRWLRRLAIWGMLLTAAIGAGAAVLAWRPLPDAPPLVDAQGMLLDDEAAARLLEMVFQASRDDDVETVDAYLAEGFSPNVRSARGDTLLTVAAYHDSQRVVARLLQAAELELDARNRMGLTAVAAAAFKGHTQTLRALLARGAEADAANGMNQTAIMFAALAGKTECVRILRDAGADAARHDAVGNSPESLARTQGAVEVVRLLTD